jgi:hypothetical protein
LQEAKAGTQFVLPVRPIERYEPVFDERGMPKTVVAEQDLAPWRRALEALLGDRDLYARESEASRRTALEFVSGIRPERLEEYLLALQPASADDSMNREHRSAAREAIENLSAERRAWLVRRLREKVPEPH